MGEYEMKLMDIDQEHLGIPDTQYDATITMSSAEFQRICRDLSALGESVKIEASKEGVRFSSEGEVGNGSVLLKQSAGREGASASSSKKAVKRDPDEDEEEEEEEKPEVDDDEGGELVAGERACSTARPGVRAAAARVRHTACAWADPPEDEIDDDDRPKKRKANGAGKVRGSWLVTVGSPLTRRRRRRQRRRPAMTSPACRSSSRSRSRSPSL